MREFWLDRPTYLPWKSDPMTRESASSCAGFSKKYRNDVRRKLHAYHGHMQARIIAHGLLQYLSMRCHTQVWRSFGSLIRIIREGMLPSEMVVATAMRKTAPEFLKDSSGYTILAEFILDKIDLGRAEGQRMLAYQFALKISPLFRD